MSHASEFINPSKKLKMWLLASRPRTLTASFIPVLVGNLLAWKALGSLNVVLFLSTLFGALLIQIGTNFINDAADFVKGADTKERIGPMRASLSGLFSAWEMFASGTLMFLLALVVGWPLIELYGTPMALLFCVSVALGYAYTTGPYPLAYRGLGDLFVFLFFGLLATIASYAIQTESMSVPSFIAGFQIGCIATLIIAMNNLRDYHQDLKAKKFTIATRLGLQGAKIEVTALVSLPFLFQLYWLQEGWMTFALPLLALPFAIRFLQTLWRENSHSKYAELFFQAALLHLGFGVLLALGIIFQMI